MRKIITLLALTLFFSACSNSNADLDNIHKIICKEKKGEALTSSEGASMQLSIMKYMKEHGPGEEASKAITAVSNKPCD